jgi:hypothetical protein
MQLESMASTSTCLSLADLSRGQLINHLPKQRLGRRCSSTPSVAAPLRARSGDLASHETIAPMRASCIGSPQHLHPPLVGAATEEAHDPTVALGLRSTRPVLGKGPSLRRCVDSRSVAGAMGGHICGRWPWHLRQRFSVPSRPPLRWPRAVVALDGMLNAVLPRWSQHGPHPKAHPDANHAAKSLLVVRRSTKTVVMIQRRVVRQTHTSPMRKDRPQSPFRRPARCRPRPHQPSVPRHDVEDCHLEATPDAHAFDTIKRIHFSQSSGHGGHMPSSWGRRAADSTPVIPRPMSLKHVADRAPRERVGEATTRPCATDGRRATLPQLALVTKWLTAVQHELFHGRAGAVMDVPRRTGLSAARGAVQALALRSADPTRDGGTRDAKPSRHRTPRFTSSPSSDHLAPPGFEGGL